MTNRNKSNSIKTVRTNTSLTKSPGYENSSQTLRSFESQYFSDYLSSTNSPKVNGVLALKQNTLDRILVRRTAFPFAVNGGYASNGSSSTILSWAQAYTSQSPLSATFPQPNDDESYRKASNQFFSDIANIKLNMAQAFAERQQTVDLIATNANRLARLYSSLRSGINPFKGNRRSKKEHASNLWLEYTYGWVPLVSDIYAASELHDLQPPSSFVRISRTHTEKGSGKYAISEGGYITGAIGETSVTVDRSLTTTVRGYVTVSDTALSFSNRIGLTNPALLAWELLPYSFVVDWFYPVGPWLERQTAELGLTFKDISVTRTLRYKAAYSGSFKINDRLAKYGYYCSGSGRAEHVQLRKVRTIGLPVKAAPKLKSPVSVSHALSALALLIQAFRR